MIDVRQQVVGSIIFGGRIAGVFKIFLSQALFSKLQGGQPGFGKIRAFDGFVPFYVGIDFFSPDLQCFGIISLVVCDLAFVFSFGQGGIGRKCKGKGQYQGNLEKFHLSQQSVFKGEMEAPSGSRLPEIIKMFRC